jgi:hypothetical protein
MSQHHAAKSPPPVTYTARAPHGALTLTCRRCKREHEYPEPGGKAIRCECGWQYENLHGVIHEEFRPRLGT